MLAWLDSTPDVYRRVKPATPPRHLVCYEEPAATAQREAREELGIEADFSIAGRRPVFVTIARTSGGPARGG